MKKTLFVFALIISFHNEIFSQQAFGELNANNIRCSVTATGDLFNRFGQEEIAGFEVPAGSDLRTIYAANLWVAGLSPDQQLKLAAETYQNDGTDWFPGPLTIDGSAEISDETMEQYNRVWEANSDDVAQHILFFELVEDGGGQAEIDEVFPGGYSIPAWFFDWPAHGDTELGQDYYLAPFFDHNENGYYDPENGDYPVFCGDECLFFIFNDKGNVHTESQGQPIGLEVQAMLYAFHSPNDDMLANTVFLKYKIINRGTQTLTNASMGMWADFDIGDGSDDFVGTDVMHGGIYAYNGDGSDDEYGDNFPFQGIAFLGGPFLDGDGIDNPLPDYEDIGEAMCYGSSGVGFDDGITDNERFGLSYSNYITPGSDMTGDPSTSIHYYNYMRGLWKNGQQWMYGGNGFSGEEVEDYPTNYFYTRFTDPLFEGTGGVEAPIWSEYGHIPGDRRMLGSMGPFTLEPGAVHYLDLAFVYVYDPTKDMALFEMTEDRLKEAKIYFNEHLQNCNAEEYIVGVQEQQPGSSFTLYPNPANDVLIISLPPALKNTPIEIFDVTGNLVKTINISGGLTQVDVSDLSTGIYTVVMKTKDHQTTQKLLIQ